MKSEQAQGLCCDEANKEKEFFTEEWVNKNYDNVLQRNDFPDTVTGIEP